MMNAQTQDAVAGAFAEALKASGYIAARTVYQGGKLDRHYRPGPHELVAILMGAGVTFFRVEGTVTADPRQLVLLPNGKEGD